MFANTPQQLAEKKLLLLYILDQIEKPLSNTQVTEFILENDIMNYFMLQQFLSELREADFIVEDITGTQHLISITEKGRNTLDYFVNRIPRHQQEEITNLIELKKEAMKISTEIKGDYRKIQDNTYIVSLSIIEKDTPIIHLEFNVNDERRAEEMCNKWKQNAIYLSNHILELFS